MPFIKLHSIQISFIITQTCVLERWAKKWAQKNSWKEIWNSGRPLQVKEASWYLQQNTYRAICCDLNQNVKDSLVYKILSILGHSE